NAPANAPKKPDRTVQFDADKLAMSPVCGLIPASLRGRYWTMKATMPAARPKQVNSQGLQDCRNFRFKRCRKSRSGPAEAGQYTVKTPFRCAESSTWFNLTRKSNMM